MDVIKFGKKEGRKELILATRRAHEGRITRDGSIIVPRKYVILRRYICILAR